MLAVGRGAFPRLESLNFGFSKEGFELFADALRAGGAATCGRSLKWVKLPQVAWEAVGYAEYARLMADGTMPNLERIELSQVENGGAVAAALALALEGGGGRRLKRLSITHLEGSQGGDRDGVPPLPTRMGLALADAELCPRIERVGLGSFALRGGFIRALRRRWRVLKNPTPLATGPRRSCPPPGTPLPRLPGVLYLKPPGLGALCGLG